MTRLAFCVDLTVCAGCESCTVACQNLNGLNADEVFTRVRRFVTGSFPDLRSTFVVNQCLHCAEPPCVAVCPTGASIKTAQGPVTVDAGSCINCQYCMAACPYDARIEDKNQNVVKKCSLCYDRILSGSPPVCVQTCLTGARMVGDLDDPQSPIHQAIQAPGTIQVAGTSFYFRLPAGVPRTALPPDMQTAGLTFVWQSVLQPAGQMIMGAAATAVLVSFAVNAMQSVRKGAADEDVDE